MIKIKQNNKNRKVRRIVQKPPQKIEVTGPIRINKYLANHGVSTRRDADKLIAAGKVTINGRRAVLGEKITATDKIEIAQKKKKDFLYYAYYKPRGVITHSPQEDEKDIAASMPIKGVFPMGRLDKESEGLMILTNDGRVTDRLLNPKYEHEKEYVVKTRVPVKDFQLGAMAKGMEVDGMTTKPAKTKRLSEKTFSITLIEGQKHEIRRICDALSLPIDSLKRVRIMNIRLENLIPNAYRKIENTELETFLKSLSL